MVSINTGWKPMLLYAVAARERVRGDGFRMTSSTARPSGEECGIGFQPVFIRTGGDASKYLPPASPR